MGASTVLHGFPMERSVSSGAVTRRTALGWAETEAQWSKSVSCIPAHYPIAVAIQGDDDDWKKEGWERERQGEKMKDVVGATRVVWQICPGAVDE